MAGIFGLLMSGAGVIKDQYYNLTSLLLPGNGTNGAQNNTFLDSGTANSGSGFTITRNGNTTQGTFSPFSQTGWGAYFDGSNDYLNVATNAAFSFGTGDFTWETWFYSVGAASGDDVFYDLGAANSSGGFAVFTTGSTLYVRIDGGNDVTYALPANWTNTWHHLAVARNGTTLTIYLDGTSVASGTRAQNVTQSTPYIGGSVGVLATYYYNGYLSNMRVVKGRSVYTANFTPATSPLGATSGGTNPPTGTQTSLLICQSNRFIDNSIANSGTGFTVIANNGVAITPFSPFAPTQSYSAAAVGGSGYFDGTGDYLSIADNAAFSYGTGDFTVEFWMYPTTTGATKRLYFHQTTSTTQFSITQLTANTINVFANNSSTTIIDITGSTAVSANTWTHVAVVRSGSTFTLYQNGTSVASGTSSASMPDPTGSLYIGALDTGSDPYTGYLSSYRIVKGTAITPPSGGPTAPLTAVSGTSLLLNFTNAGVVDATAKNVLETVGNAQISTTQSKWGGGSIYFDGTGDWLTVPKAGNWSIGSSEPFTIEAWVYLTAAQANYRALLSDYNSGSPGSSKYLFINSSGIEFQLGTTAGTVASCTQSFSQNQWYYIAITRNSSNVISMYVDGVSKTVSQATQSGAFLDVGSIFYVGRWGGTTAYEWYGYIDDLRITKGVARTITASPSAPFPLQ